MSEKKIGDESSRSSKYSINPKNWNRKSTTTIVLISILIPFGIMIGLNWGGIIGAFRGLDVQDETYHIGFYELEFEFVNSSNEIESDVTITVDLLNYYTNELIEEDYEMNSSTVYETTNVTILYFKSVSGLIDTSAEYREGAYLIYTSQDENEPMKNIIFENMKGKISDFDLTIYHINNDGTDVYGYLNVGDITEERFIIDLAVKNTGNGTFSEQKIIPESYRYNINISNSAFWWKFDCIVYNITFLSDGIDTYNTVQDIYYDYDNECTYLIFPYLYGGFEGTFQYLINCATIPTSFEFIQGQWDGDIILSLP